MSDPPATSKRPTAPVGSRVDAGPTTQHGPLGKVDPARPAAKGTVPRPPLGVATSAVAVGLLALFGILLVFGSIAERIHEQEAFALDAWATPFLHGVRSPLLDTLMTTLTTAGSSLIVVPLFIGVGLALYIRRRYGALLFLATALGGALLIDFVMKLVFQRPRPKLDYAAVLPDYSFPSGHSMNGIVFYVGLALVAWSIFGRRVGIPATLLAALLGLGIGVSRIYLGYHYLTDVVGGFLAGLAWLLIVGAVFRIRPTTWPWRLPARRLLR